MCLRPQITNICSTFPSSNTADTSCCREELVRTASVANNRLIMVANRIVNSKWCRGQKQTYTFRIRLKRDKLCSIVEVLLALRSLKRALQYGRQRHRQSEKKCDTRPEETTTRGSKKQLTISQQSPVNARSSRECFIP